MHPAPREAELSRGRPENQLRQGARSLPRKRETSRNEEGDRNRDLDIAFGTLAGLVGGGGHRPDQSIHKDDGTNPVRTRASGGSLVEPQRIQDLPERRLDARLILLGRDEDDVPEIALALH